MKILINGKPETQISVLDRAVSYGDGLFETIGVKDGEPLLWEAHWKRLCDGCSRLLLPVPDETTVRNEALELSENLPSGVLKILYTRGESQRGYKLPETAAPTRILSAMPAATYPSEWWQKGVKLHLCEMRLGQNPMLAGIKHLNRLEQVLARAEWQDENIAEGLLLDSRGYVTEATASNVFWVHDQVVLTPDLEECGVAGVMRGKVLDVLNQLGYSVQISRFTLRDVYNADELFLTNSLIGIWPVRDFDGTRFDTNNNPLTRQLQQYIQQTACLPHEGITI